MTTPTTQQAALHAMENNIVQKRKKKKNSSGLSRVIMSYFAFMMFFTSNFDHRARNYGLSMLFLTPVVFRAGFRGTGLVVDLPRGRLERERIVTSGRTSCTVFYNTIVIVTVNNDG